MTSNITLDDSLTMVFIKEIIEMLLITMGLEMLSNFEYNENDLIKYDSKGLQSNTEKATNRFGGKKYTSKSVMFPAVFIDF